MGELRTRDQKVRGSSPFGRACSEGVWVRRLPCVGLNGSQFSCDPSLDWLVGWCGRSGADGLGLYVDVWLGWPGAWCAGMNETRTELGLGPIRRCSRGHDGAMTLTF